MKIKSIMPALCVAVVMMMIFIACSSDDDTYNDTTTSQEVENAIEIVTTGYWVVSSFINNGQDSSEDETSNYSGFVFIFDNNGLLSALNSSGEILGTWSIQSDHNDNSINSIEITMIFAVPDGNDFESLSGEWDILLMADAEMSLREISSDDAPKDVLSFIKN